MNKPETLGGDIVWVYGQQKGGVSVMGLDQYARKIKLSTKEIIDCNFWCWRMNRHLNGWMANLYHEKYGDTPEYDETFDCVPLLLDKDDIRRLMEDIKNKKLPDAHGFFWGNGEYDKEVSERDLAFCKKALKALEEEDVGVEYWCWY